MSLEKELYRLELQTLDNAVRTDPKLMDQLLGEEFVEFGASGRKWNKAEVLEALPAEGELIDVELDDLTTRLLGEQHVLLSYKLTVQRDRGTNTSMRSSVWERGDLGWRMVFHQGTPCQ